MKQDYYNTLIETLHLYDFKPQSQEIYKLYVRKFLEFTNKEPESLTLEDARNYILYLIDVRSLANETVNTHNAVLKFFYETVMDIPWNSRYIPRMKRIITEPEILTPEQVGFFIDSIPNLKYKAITSTLYSSGLRIGEVVHLKCSDIYMKRLQIRIQYGKNRSDRYAALSKRNLELLIHYWRECGQPTDWLFPSRATGACLSKDAVQVYLKEHAKRIGWSEKTIHPHLFRHCYATHMLESGVDLVTIQHLLGHKSLTSTERYLHLTSKMQMNLPNPFDQLDVRL